MTKSKKKTKRKTAPSPPKRRRTFLILLIPVAVGVAVVLSYTSRSVGPEREAASLVQQANGPDAGKTEKSSDLNELVGRWVRPDGGYVIDIRFVGPRGGMDAAYFNPRSIHVSRAEASVDGDTFQVFIELRDQGYPGSTYTLRYVREQKALVGTYYQAAMDRNFEVLFVRQE